MARGYEITNIVEALRVEHDLTAGDFDDAAWSRPRAAQIARYWSGEDAPPGRRAEARALWNEHALSVRFDCRQAEPLVVSAAPRLEQKTIGLWDRDVCELFITPERDAIRHYFEFEVAPTGEWIDLKLTVRPQGRATDWHYHSGVTAAARLREDSITLGLRVPWKHMGRAPRAGERWRCNLFRCVGRDPSRGYLAWQPTHTPEPSFHVPDKFGWMAFK
ncbi:MAG TPA: carbohydrate-binding family 9-like protein [Pyrinomonadaceae bacterium]|nr:carbohydrate-binding family 9-like protein [Pyrinomonadaceae bacterium]